ncbi:LysR family transcriptional regulator [Acuticoccus sp. I52.16.1]|uniref:LysR family transcriptional regulator n=1 Tax=Acuticoccus sp. I52.16.1 TaxID=2928472 RepID=UPI001FD5A229|nr:LysR family transcriptional regulator [Acuticoccus sp. I52.16.1]UOM33765.1 LysR family transcriptional regulator [Acuticoccus sp. I52.16.1]
MQPSFDWDLLQSFLAIARAGTLTEAARRMGADHSTLSRRLAALERALETKLFDRGSSGYALTPDGLALLRHAETIESTMLSIQSDVGTARTEASGVVRIGAPDGFGTAILSPAIGRLQRDHPNLEIQLVALPRNFSTSRREADIAIGLSSPDRGRLHVRRLTDYELGVYAAAAQAPRWAGLAEPQDLARAPFVSYIDDLIFAPELDYLPAIAKGIRPRLTSSNLLAQKEAAAAGAGLCVLPCFLADDDPRLTRIMPRRVALTRTFYMVVHSDTRDLARVRLTADFIAEEVRRQAGRFLPAGPAPCGVAAAERTA